MKFEVKNIIEKYNYSEEKAIYLNGFSIIDVLYRKENDFTIIKANNDHILPYSIYEDIKDYEILKYIDILVDGPYIDEQRDLRLRWRGSRNQRVIDIRKTMKSGKIVLSEE